MSNLIHINKDYAAWIGELKIRIRQSQIKAAVKVNTELLQLYWQLGSDIVEKQKNAKWGDGFLKQLSQDLSAEFPEMKGFSLRNIERIRKWYITYKDVFPFATQLVPQIEDSSKTAQPVPQSFFSIPWGHHILIMQRCKDVNMALFYIQQTIENNWSRTVLDWQIDSNLYERQGKAISNFKRTLPTPQSDLAQQITKDPYVIDIMGVRQDMQERELEEHPRIGGTSRLPHFQISVGTGQGLHLLWSPSTPSRWK